MYRSLPVVRFWRGAGIECYYTVCIDSLGEECGKRGKSGEEGEEWGRRGIRGKSGEEGGEERGAVLLMHIGTDSLS